MKRYLYFSVLIFMFQFLGGCEKKTYQSTEPIPTLEVTAMQDTYVIDQAAYLQIRINQQGYEGGHMLSVVLQEGACSLTMQGSEVPTSGEWISMPSTSEILTLTPTQVGPLRISFEVKDKDGEQSRRSFIYFSVTGSSTLEFEINAPTTSSISSSVEIVLRLTKTGWTGTIPVRFEQITGSGTLQYGSVTVNSGDDIATPANSEQTLYYTPGVRGIHKLQFSATDGYTTQYVNAEIIITQ